MKKLVVLLLIALGGAGIAYGATTVFFSPGAEEADLVEPTGLVDDLDIEVEKTAAPSPSPTPTATPAGDGTTTVRTATQPASAPPAEDGGRIRRSAPPSQISVTQGTVAHDEPEGPCDDEDNERERELCEDELEAEEEEAEREAEEEEDQNG